MSKYQSTFIKYIKTKKAVIYLDKKIFKKILIAFLLLILPMYILIMPTYAFSPSGETYDGIDVSAWQGTINFEEVKQAGIEIVYIKASEGRTLVDPYFNVNYENAKKNGLKVGFYHFVDARSVEQAVEEAKFFVSVVSGKTPDCKLAMDFERFGSLTYEQINEIGLTFMRTVENLSNKEMVIYSNTYNARTIFSGELTNYPLWVAQYEVGEPSANGKWNTWAGWQYTSNGSVYGINGRVDRDKFTKEVFLNETSVVVPVPEENEKPSVSGTTKITIKWGDTLSKLAIEYNTTVARLVELNNIQNPNLIYAGEKLIVPKETAVEDNDKQTISGKTLYIVKRGDTLNKIAAQFGTTAIAIAKENNIKNINLIYVGQRLTIPTTTYDSNYILYKIKWGDTLWSISRRYGVPIATIVRLNRIQNPNLIYAGDTLKL